MKYEKAQAETVSFECIKEFNNYSRHNTDPSLTINGPTGHIHYCWSVTLSGHSQYETPTCSEVSLAVYKCSDVEPYYDPSHILPCNVVS